MNYDGEFSYVAICSHGKLRAAIVDCKNTKKCLPKEIASFAKWSAKEGGHVDRIKTDSVRSGDWDCKPCDEAHNAKRSKREATK